MANKVNGKRDFVVDSEWCSVDDEGFLLEAPENWCFTDHNPLKREQFHPDLDEVFLDYKAILNRHKGREFFSKADEYAEQAQALRDCGSHEERSKLKVIIAAENKLSEQYGLTVEQIREALAEVSTVV